MDVQFYEYDQWCDWGGEGIYGRVYRPQLDGKLPACVFAHGLNGTHEIGDRYLRALARLGVVGYGVDFRGGSDRSRSAGSTTHMSVMTEAQDLQAALGTMRSWDFVDPDRCFVMGESLGGVVAAVVAGRFPQWVNKLVLLYPGFAVVDVMRNIFPSKDLIPDTYNALGWINVGKCFATDVWDHDFNADIRAYPGKVLILHGADDQIVDVRYSRELARKYAHAKLHVLPHAGHGFDDAAFKRAMRYVEPFLLGRGA